MGEGENELAGVDGHAEGAEAALGIGDRFARDDERGGHGAGAGKVADARREIFDRLAPPRRRGTPLLPRLRHCAEE